MSTSILAQLMSTVKTALEAQVNLTALDIGLTAKLRSAGFKTGWSGNSLSDIK